MIYSAILKKIQFKEINVNTLITLCEIKNYDEFSKELEELIASKRNKDLIYKMFKVMQGDFVLGNKKYKEFAEKYKDTISIMKKNRCLYDMTVGKYDSNGKVKKNSFEDYFSNFILEHKDNIDRIKELVTRIQNLGFDKIEYSEEFDFTDFEYELNTTYGSKFQFLDNIEIIPTYEISPIKYKTSNSCYRMEIPASGYKNSISISDFGRKIELNSLLFDPEILPEVLTVDTTIGVITNKARECKKDSQIIRDCVDMSITIEDLINQYNDTKRKLLSIENLKDKEELKLVLQNILNELTKLQTINSAFNEEILNSTKNIDENKIEEEKQLYLKRRWSAGIDCC